MRLKLIFSVLILITPLLLIACKGIDKVANSNLKTTTGPETIYADGARRVTTDELEAMMKNGEAFVVDVRNQASYDLGHIPGSRLIPSAEIANHLGELPRNKMIVTYCS